MDTNKMREQFEKRIHQPAGSYWCEKDRTYRYEDYDKASSQIHECQWQAWIAAWQASREAVVVEMGAPSHWVADYAACGGGMNVFDAEKAAKVTDPMCSKTPSYTIHALEKAGLKVAP